MIQQQQQTPPIVFELIETPARETTLGDVILASMGLTGVLVLIAVVLGAVFAFLLVRWHRRHPPEDQHMPSISPLVADRGAPPSSQAQ